jgi:hypothetical protein
MTDQLSQNIKNLANVLNKSDLQAFIEAAKKTAPPFSSEAVAEITMHKLRAEIPGVRSDLKLKSTLWLRSHGYKRLSETRS